MRRFLIIVIVLVIIGAGGFALYKYRGSLGGGLLPADHDEASKGYSAVFLTNDQVYFGKVSVAAGTVILKDVYYIRLNQTQVSEESSASEQPQLSLVKLGDQIHGPIDEMRINSDHVLFVERIKDSSTVVKAILQEKEQRSGKPETPLTP